MKMLQIGDHAPDFSAIDHKGKIHKLSDYKGKKLVVFFYPQAGTPTCTVEACHLRDNYKKFKKRNYVLLGVSPDNPKKQARFVEKHQLPFPLLADVDHAVIDAFGVWGPKKFMGINYDGLHRTTFVIDENGIIEDVISKVKSKMHTEQILKE